MAVWGRGGGAYHDLKVAELGCQVQGGVVVVIKVGVADEAWVVLDDAADEEDVVEVNGPLEPCLHVNPRLLCQTEPGSARGGLHVYEAVRRMARVEREWLSSE